MAAWLRLYTETMDDPKMGQLSDSEFRTWIGLLCLAGKADAEGDTRHTIEQASWSLRRDSAAAIAHLTSLGLVAISADSTLIIANWSKRQYRSDSSLERVRRYRNSDSPLPIQICNGPEQNRTEQIQNRTDTDGFAQFWDAYPKKIGKGQAERAWSKVDASLLTSILSAIEAQKADRAAAAKVGAFRPEWKHPATWLNAQAWLDEIQPVEAPRSKSDPKPPPRTGLTPAEQARVEATQRAMDERAAKLAAPVSDDAKAKAAAFLKASGVVR